MNKTLRAKDGGLTIAIIMLVIALAACVYQGLAYYQSKYSNPGITTGNTVDFTFKTSTYTQPYADTSFKPTSGEFDYGMKHTSGTSAMRYSALFKDTTASYYTTLFADGYLANNYQTFGPYGHVSVYSWNTYIFRIQKNNYWGTGSAMTVDYMIH